MSMLLMLLLLVLLLSWWNFLLIFDIFGVLSPPPLVWCKNCGHMISEELPQCCPQPEPE